MAHIKLSPIRLVATGLILIGLAACNNQQKKNTEENTDQTKVKPMMITAQDSAFLVKADGINLEEIKLGNLAKDKSETESVDQLGEMLVKDHTELSEVLSKLADKKSMSLPTELNEKAIGAYNTLKEMSGTEFDKKFSTMMVEGHKKAISLFKKDSANTNDPAVQKYAIHALPILRKHLAHAEKCKEEVDQSS